MCDATNSLPCSVPHHPVKECQCRPLGGADLRLYRPFPVGQIWAAQLHQLGSRRAARQQRPASQQNTGIYKPPVDTSSCLSVAALTLSLPPQGNCVVMIHGNPERKTGMWASRACEMESNGFICQKQQGPSRGARHAAGPRENREVNFFFFWLKIKVCLRLRPSSPPPCRRPWSWAG